MVKTNLKPSPDAEVKHLQQVEQELSERLRQQAAAAEISQVALAAKDLQEIMDRTVNITVQTLHLDFCKILELQPGGDKFLLKAGYGWKDGLVGTAHLNTGKDSQAGFAILSKKPVIVKDLRQETRFSDADFLEEHGVTSGMSVMIPGRERVYGVLGAHTRDLRVFTQYDINFLQSVANVLATAVDRVNIEQALRLSRDQLAVILESVADGITVHDAYGRMIFANNGAVKMLSLPSEQAVLNSLGSEILSDYEIRDEQGQLVTQEMLPGHQVLMGVDEAVARLRYLRLSTGEVRWVNVKARPIKDPDGKVHLAVNLFHDITDIKNNELNQRFLAEAGDLLAGSLDYKTTLKNVASLAVKDLADWCVVHIIDEDGAARQLVVAHVDPKKIALVEELQRRYPPDVNTNTGVYKVLRTGQPEYYPYISKDMLVLSAKNEEHLGMLRRLGLRSAFTMPLVSRGRVVGALSFVWAESKRTYHQNDLALAEELARRAAIAIENAQLYKEAQELNEDLEQRVTQRTSQIQTIIAQLRSEIIERKKVEEALRNSQQILESLFESTPDATILIHPDGRILRVNEQVEIVFGYQREDLIGQPVEILLPKRYLSRHKLLRDVYEKDPHMRMMGGGTMQLYGQRKDGSEFPVEIMLNPIDGTDQGLGEKQVICAVRDITLRKQMEAELAEVNRRLIDSLEAERLFLAQELHDSALQDLYGIAYQLKGLEDQIKESGGGEILSSTRQLMQSVINTIRTICGDLRPPALAPFGLEKAIRAHLDRLSERYPDLMIETDLDPDEQKLPERTRLAMFRIYQHAVSNVIRHAKATQLTVRFKLEDHRVTLSIKDNGCGFVLPSKWVDLAREGHLGLVGTAERAQAIGGELKIETAPGEGTAIEVVVPISHQ